MTKIRSAAKVAENIAWMGLNKAEITKILEEWQKERQPQPDESAVELLMDIFSKHPDIGKRDDLQNDILNAIARHTAAKVAAAKMQGYTEGYNDCAFKQNNAFWDKRLDEREERGWKRGAEAMREQAAKQVERDYQEPNALAYDVRHLPLPPYQKDGK